MTSIPASRSARAITLAPRSWPSRPGLAMTTRILRIEVFSAPAPLHQGDLFILAPDVAQRVAHLPYCRIGANTVEQHLHGIALAARPGPQLVERAAHRVVVPSPAQLLETLQLDIRRGVVDVENRHPRLVRLDEVVDADDDLRAPLDCLLELVRGLGDLALGITVLDRRDHAAEPIDHLEVLPRP